MLNTRHETRPLILSNILDASQSAPEALRAQFIFLAVIKKKKKERLLPSLEPNQPLKHVSGDSQDDRLDDRSLVTESLKPYLSFG